MDPRFSPPGDGGNPQNALTGQLFDVNAGTTDITVPAQYSKLRFWRNTRVASLATGQSTTLDSGVGTLGYEWDVDADNGFRPAGLMDMSSTTIPRAEIFTDYGSYDASPTAPHAPPDPVPCRRAARWCSAPGPCSGRGAWTTAGWQRGRPDRSAMQQATVNLFADMGAQPATLMSGLTPATASTDTTAAHLDDHLAVARAPRSPTVRPSPSAGPRPTQAAAWSPASRSPPTAARPGIRSPRCPPRTPPSPGATPGSRTGARRRRSSPGPSTTAATWRHRAPGVTVNVTCPCSIWGTNVTPTTADSGDSASIEVGVKFKTDTFGFVTGIRFYKASTNTGTHIGNLWTATGQLLASATFTNETASGWQQVNFSQPVPLNTNTTYVASYFAPNGHYSQDGSYFYTTPPMGTTPPYQRGQPAPARAAEYQRHRQRGLLLRRQQHLPDQYVQRRELLGRRGVLPAGVHPPGQVTNVTATAGYASATVTWSAPASGGSVTTYTITPYIGSTAQTPTTVTGTPRRSRP